MYYLKTVSLDSLLIDELHGELDVWCQKRHQSLGSLTIDKLSIINYNLSIVKFL